jgi:hypothetical protein
MSRRRAEGRIAGPHDKPAVEWTNVNGSETAMKPEIQRGIRKWLLVLDLFARLGFGKCHVKSEAGHDCVPGFVFGNSAALDRTPKVDDFFLRHAFEKVLIILFV